ncbi:GMC oxidoreductase [Psychrobacter raelei]|uniref:GMC oxidoreductase n=1 Tax=Psychrobacter raelei TaxID=2565531 RepID=UPI003F5DE8FF
MFVRKPKHTGCWLALNIRGVKGLQVAETSVVPTLVSANTNAPTIMIAKKIADTLKSDYGAFVSPIAVTSSHKTACKALKPATFYSLNPSKKDTSQF